MKNDKYTVTLLSDYTPPPFLIESANLEFTLDPKTTIVKAQLHIKRNKPTNIAPLKLDGVNLELQEVKINGQLLPTTSYQIDPEYLTIPQVPDDFILETTVKIFPEQNLSCIGLYLSNNNFCTQNEPHGFRYITYFLDRPDILTKFTTTIIANKDKYPILLSNGNLIDECHPTESMPTSHHVVWQDPYPKSPYLFALVAGNFSYLEDQHTTVSGRKVTLRIYADPKYLEQCHYAMLFLKQAMEWDEKNFGLEYDLDLYQIVAINDFNFGAMENKGLNIFNTRVLLASPETASDNDLLIVASVVAHEYFHNWTGNRVTCRDWFQIGLKEGLTTLREQLFMEDTYGYFSNRIDSVNFITTKQFAEDAGPLSHPVRLKSYIEVNNFYTCTIYDKSAEISRMLITIFGREVFHKILATFLAKFDGKAVTIEDFVTVAAEFTHANLTPYKLWYDQNGTPQLNITGEFLDNNFTLTVKQQYRDGQQNFYIPLAYGFVEQPTTNINTKLLIIDQKEQQFVFNNMATKPIISLLRGFSAPIKITYPYKDDELLFLALNDYDPINRCEAGQKLIVNAIINLLNTNQPYQLPAILINLFRAILSDTTLEQNLAAELLQLPTESYLYTTLDYINVEAIHNILEFIKQELATTLKTEMLACYARNNTSAKYQIDTLAISKRKLKNVILSHLATLNTEDIFTLIIKQLNQADNLTDILGALGAIINSTYSQRDQILAEYYQKWQNQPNLINKWFSINVSIRSSNTLDRIRQLMQLPEFNIKNPNNVLSVIRTFIESNKVNFHLIDGEGYRFIADQVIIIDKFNPHVAALIATSLTQGEKLDSVRQQLMQQQLVRINREPGLSKNVYEITMKAII